MFQKKVSWKLCCASWGEIISNVKEIPGPTYLWCFILSDEVNNIGKGILSPMESCWIYNTKNVVLQGFFKRHCMFYNLSLTDMKNDIAQWFLESGYRIFRCVIIVRWKILSFRAGSEYCDGSMLQGLSEHPKHPKLQN